MHNKILKKLLFLSLLLITLSGCMSYDWAVYERIFESSFEDNPIYITSSNGDKYEVILRSYSVPAGMYRRTTKGEIIIKTENEELKKVIKNKSFLNTQLYHSVGYNNTLTLYFSNGAHHDKFNSPTYHIFTANFEDSSFEYQIKSKEMEEIKGFAKIKDYTYKGDEFLYYYLSDNNKGDFLIKINEKEYSADDIYTLLANQLGVEYTNSDDSYFHITNIWGNSLAIDNHLEANLRLSENRYELLLEWSEEGIKIVEVIEH